MPSEGWSPGQGALPGSGSDGPAEAPAVRRAGREQGVELRFLEGVRARFPDDPLVLKALGDLYTRVGRIDDGLAVDRRLVRLCPEEDMVWYNLACSCALAGRSDEAFTALDHAVELGYADADWAARDEDLKPVAADPRFVNVLARMKERRKVRRP